MIFVTSFVKSNVIVSLSDPAPSQTTILVAPLVRSPGYPTCKRMCRVMLLAGHLAVPYFYTVSHIRHDYRNIVRREICVVFFCATFISNVAHSKNNSVRCDHECTYSTRYYYQIVMKLEFSG